MKKLYMTLQKSVKKSIQLCKTPLVAISGAGLLEVKTMVVLIIKAIIG